MSDNKRNSKYRHPRYYVIGLSDNAEQLQITTRSFRQVKRPSRFTDYVICNYMAFVVNDLQVFYRPFSLLLCSFDLFL